MLLKRIFFGLFFILSTCHGVNVNTNNPMSIEEINQLNNRCYDAKADYWDRFPFPEFLPKEILQNHHPISGMNALDIGSGTGLLAEWLCKNGFSVLCLDPSSEMVGRCREKGLTTIQTTLQTFSCDQKFGLITAVLSLIHLPKQEILAQLKRISDWLNPDGLFVLALIEGEGEGVAETHSDYPRYFSWYTRQEVIDLTRKDFDCLFERKVGSPVSYLVFIFRKKPELTIRE